MKEGNNTVEPRKIFLSVKLRSKFVAIKGQSAAILQHCSYAVRIRWAGHMARVGEDRGCVGSCWENRRERDHWGDLGVDGWIILGCISRRWNVGIWTGLGWPRIGKGGGIL
jgi:hypothetical protein